MFVQQSLQLNSNSMPEQKSHKEFGGTSNQRHIIIAWMLEWHALEYTVNNVVLDTRNYGMKAGRRVLEYTVNSVVLVSIAKPDKDDRVLCSGCNEHPAASVASHPKSSRLTFTRNAWDQTS